MSYPITEPRDQTGPIAHVDPTAPPTAASVREAINDALRRNDHDAIPGLIRTLATCDRGAAQEVADQLRDYLGIVVDLTAVAEGSQMAARPADTERR